jgi:transposase
MRPPTGRELAPRQELEFRIHLPSAGSRRTFSPSNRTIICGCCRWTSPRGGRAKLVYLPPYSPDLNPIEQAVAKLKALLRKGAERSIDALWSRIGTLLGEFTPQECAAYLRHAGYGAT